MSKEDYVVVRIEDEYFEKISESNEVIFEVFKRNAAQLEKPEAEALVKILKSNYSLDAEIEEVYEICPECREEIEEELVYDKIDECCYCEHCLEVIKQDRKDAKVPDYEFNGNSDWWREE